MAIKRKFDADFEDTPNVRQKQLRLVPFPNCEPDTDSVMSEAEPLYPHHIRIPSNVSTCSTASDASSGTPIDYPSFNLYPLPFFNANGSVDPDSHNYAHYSALSASPSPTVTSTSPGLLQPHSNFTHHGQNCAQIPRLRIACAPGLSGRRTMWSHCEECGAIAMVDTE